MAYIQIIGTAETDMDTQADIDWRFKNKRALDQARKNTQAKYPVLTADNFAEAAAYQEEQYEDTMTES